jgi:23S rRNA (adenine2503-C2)-methyltransferase
MNEIDPTRTRGREGANVHPLARTPEEWTGVLEAMGERKFRAKQIFRWIHERGVLDAAQMTDLSKELREKLNAIGLSTPAEVSQVARSSDGTRKLLLRLTDGYSVECVLIPMTRDAELEEEDDVELEEDSGGQGTSGVVQRVTLCISTQVGCAMGCVFCASGQAGLKRGLGAGEVIAQVLIAKQHLEPNEQLRNVVFMGMGEPLHHYEETARAIRLLTHPDGIRMSPRRITVSTVGLIPGIRKLGQDFGGKLGLAISLHAPDNTTRDRILPMNARFPVEELLAELRRYPLPPRRRITLEYTLIEGQNCTTQHASQLAKLLRGLRCKVNLIPMNPIEASGLTPPSEVVVEAFRQVLADNRISCSVRKRRGDDVDAACGQLALKQPLVELRRQGVERS